MRDNSSARRGGALLAILALLAVAVMLTAGCTTGTDDGTPAPGNGLSGTLAVTGSTTVLPIAQLTAEAFMAENSGADIQVSGGGSSVGIQAVGEGTASIGMASRDLKDVEREKYPELVSHAIAIDGIALIVNPKNAVDSLTPDQIRGIYNGTYTDWNQVGGASGQIVVVGRDSASGTREYFHEAVMQKEDFVRTQLEKNSNGAVAQTISQTPGAIGYVGLGYLEGNVKGISVTVNGNAVPPTLETVKAGTYPISREVFMFTKGEASDLAKAYIEFILSPDGQAIVEEEGFVRVD
ncbi:phosphate ABC transporter substrate-binding protein [Methanoculleus sp. Wushi-C6]|uniref:Phosphate ABC transporter substrate-binding protein n=1 Tax=Methanoculleus caldifontis TaxID=2651577 RepID=A0ABU3X3M3_9EURY|nr:phosphate ABC transporter substrate-binding protein [Methanoculleus sp. Wushi-C6]MDV2482659.1 phosphate ABC transporter substrate-binding protein [Methanoculleus sp. Wushi-C6]